MSYVADHVAWPSPSISGAHARYAFNNYHAPKQPAMRFCLSVCLFVYDYSRSRTTGYEAAYEPYKQLQCYKGKKNNVSILLKRLRSRDMA